MLLNKVEGNKLCNQNNRCLFCNCSFIIPHCYRSTFNYCYYYFYELAYLFTTGYNNELRFQRLYFLRVQIKYLHYVF